MLPGADGAPSQRPFAAILGCSDARVPLELIFNEGPNDLFVVRAAGNEFGSDALGSLRYAIDHLGGSLKLIVVLGHSGCGAVSAAVDVFLNPADYLSLATARSLREILDRLLVVVQASARKLVSAFGADVVLRAGYRSALVETAIITNAAWSGRGNPAGLRCPTGKAVSRSPMGSTCSRAATSGRLSWIRPPEPGWLLRRRTRPASDSLATPSCGPRALQTCSPRSCAPAINSAKNASRVTSLTEAEETR